jgi:hypothetical protein
LGTALLSQVHADVPASSTYVAQSPFKNENITISLNVPSNSTDSLFFHFSGPSSHQWVAFGIGGQMKGALIFVAYTSADGKNVTLSPRIATGHSMPRHTDDVKVEVLAGSGIVGEIMIVNAKCTGCREWDGGSASVTSTSQSMIWALGPDDDLVSDDVSASIKQHDVYSIFNLDLQKATGQGGVPVASNDTDANIDGPSVVNGPLGGSGNGRRAGVAFHGFMMVAAFLVVFPAGYLFLRVFERVWLHWGVQSFALLMIFIGTGAGIGLSKRQDIVRFNTLL